jgi:hypothetical protein
MHALTVRATRAVVNPFPAPAADRSGLIDTRAGTGW